MKPRSAQSVGRMGARLAGRSPRSRPSAREAAFTLAEVLIALAILAFLVLVAAPSYHDWIAEMQLANSAQQLAESFALARSEAIKHGGRVNLCKTAGTGRCVAAGGWETGWIVFADDNANAQVETDELVVRSEPAAPPGVTARANQPLANYVSFTSLGHARLLSGALQMGTITVCRPGRLAYQVVLAHSGRVRVDKTNARCS